MPISTPHSVGGTFDHEPSKLSILDLCPMPTPSKLRHLVTPRSSSSHAKGWRSFKEARASRILRVIVHTSPSHIKRTLRESKGIDTRPFRSLLHGTHDVLGVCHLEFSNTRDYVDHRGGEEYISWTWYVGIKPEFIMVAKLWAFGLALFASAMAIPQPEGLPKPPGPPKPPGHGPPKPPGPVKLPTSFRWKSTNQLISPKNDSREINGIKDPTAVEYKGVYHVFATTAKAEGYNMVYLNFTDWSKAASAPFYYLDQSPIGTGYRAAPQVFYFAPQKLWYLVYQNDNAAYSTNPDISNPAGWTAPKTFYKEMPQIIKDHIGPYYWVDMWVICDAKLCHLFSSDDNGQLYRSETSIKDFPNGFNDPVIAMQDPERWRLFEASCIYKIKGTNQYLLLVEAISLTDERRWYRSWTSTDIAGPWKVLAAEEDTPFARSNNVEFPRGAEPWTKDISHGEMVRRGNLDQHLEIDPCRLEFLYQGEDPDASGDYTTLPWRLALLTLKNKPAGCP